MDANANRGAAPLRKSFDACIAQSEGITAQMQACMAVEAEYQNGRLATAYAAMQASLPPAGRQALESEHNVWLAERRKTCAWNPAEEGQGQMLEADGCAIEMTAWRASQLEALLPRF